MRVGLTYSSSSSAALALWFTSSNPKVTQACLQFPGLCVSGINRIDGAPAVGGWVGASGPYGGWVAGLEVRPVPCPEPTGRTSCIPPLWCVCSRRRRLALKVVGLRLLVRKSAPLLPPGSVNKSALYSPACTRLMACWGQKKQNQEEEEHLACHATLSHMRLRVSLGWSLKSLSRGSCSAS